MSNELKPCPFCGAQPRWQGPDDLACPECDILVAWPDWNSRPIEDALAADLAAARAEVEALRAELREIKDQRDEDRLRRDPGVCY